MGFGHSFPSLPFPSLYHFSIIFLPFITFLFPAFFISFSFFPVSSSRPARVFSPEGASAKGWGSRSSKTRGFHVSCYDTCTYHSIQLFLCIWVATFSLYLFCIYCLIIEAVTSTWLSKPIFDIQLLSINAIFASPSTSESLLRLCRWSQ